MGEGGGSGMVRREGSRLLAVVIYWDSSSYILKLKSFISLLNMPAWHIHKRDRKVLLQPIQS